MFGIMSIDFQGVVTHIAPVEPVASGIKLFDH